MKRTNNSASRGGNARSCSCRNRLRRIAVILFSSVLLSACGSVGETTGLIAGITAVTGVAPTQEIQQTYYLGVFDPQEQVQPSVYRVRVHGQASLISFVKFQSGWVPAEVADSLSSSISFNKESKDLEINLGEKTAKNFKTGRRLIVFGPEGFRESPRNHRLAIAMGTSPEAYFNAINEALGAIAFATQGAPNDPNLQRDLFNALEVIATEQQRITDLEHKTKGGPQ